MFGIKNETRSGWKARTYVFLFVLICAVPLTWYGMRVYGHSMKSGALRNGTTEAQVAGFDSMDEPAVSVLVKHVILIVLENKNASYVLSGAEDPYIRYT